MKSRGAVVLPLQDSDRPPRRRRARARIRRYMFNSATRAGGKAFHSRRPRGICNGGMLFSLFPNSPELFVGLSGERILCCHYPAVSQAGGHADHPPPRSEYRPRSRARFFLQAERESLAFRGNEQRVQKEAVLIV